MNIDELQQCVATFLATQKETPSSGAESLSSRTDLFRAGLIDSLRSIELINHVEKTYAVKIPLRRMTPDDLRTIEKMHSAFARLQLL